MYYYKSRFIRMRIILYFKGFLGINYSLNYFEGYYLMIKLWLKVLYVFFLVVI